MLRPQQSSNFDRGIFEFLFCSTRTKKKHQETDSASKFVTAADHIQGVLKKSHYNANKQSDYFCGDYNPFHKCVHIVLTQL